MSHDDSAMYERAIQEGREKEMSGCHPVETQCGCSCHKGINKFMYLSNPPTICCTCIGVQEERNASPLIEHIQSLEKRINELNEKFTDYYEGVCADINIIRGILKQKVIGKMPHRCPNCLGTGEWELLSLEECIKNNNMKFKPCNACEGKGIVWG